MPIHTWRAHTAYTDVCGLPTTHNSILFSRFRLFFALVELDSFKLVCHADYDDVNDNSAVTVNVPTTISKKDSVFVRFALNLYLRFQSVDFNDPSAHVSSHTWKPTLICYCDDDDDEWQRFIVIATEHWAPHYPFSHIFWFDDCHAGDLNIHTNLIYMYLLCSEYIHFGHSLINFSVSTIRDTKTKIVIFQIFFFI